MPRSTVDQEIFTKRFKFQRIQFSPYLVAILYCRYSIFCALNLCNQNGHKKLILMEKIFQSTVYCYGVSLGIQRIGFSLAYNPFKNWKFVRHAYGQQLILALYLLPSPLLTSICGFIVNDLVLAFWGNTTLEELHATS